MPHNYDKFGKRTKRRLGANTCPLCHGGQLKKTGETEGLQHNYTILQCNNVHCGYIKWTSKPIKKSRVERDVQTAILDPHQRF
jgi:hypothetical protein